MAREATLPELADFLIVEIQLQQDYIDDLEQEYAENSAQDQRNILGAEYQRLIRMTQLAALVNTCIVEQIAKVTQA